MFTNCECCGAARTFYLNTTLADGQRITVKMEGFEDDLEAVTAALSQLRAYQRDIKRRRQRDAADL